MDTTVTPKILESLVLDQSISIEGTFAEDLAKLQDLLLENAPAYVLAKLDDPSTEWLAIYYVPDSAKVRDKVSSNTKLNSFLESDKFPG